MIKPSKSLVLICSLAALSLALSLPAYAQEKAASTPPPPAKEKLKKRADFPFNGKITAVDKTNKTLSLNGKDADRVFQITSATRLFKAGKPAVLDEATVGEDVTGQARKSDGKTEALSVYLGPRPDGKAKKAEKAPETKPEPKPEEPKPESK
jgi:hypothetical protein